MKDALARPFDPYADIAEFYDLEHDPFDEDILSLMNFIESTGDPVLELGCGTGRFLVPIAETGFRVTGLDISGPMLERARSRMADVENRDLISLVEGDLTSADSAPGGPFGVVLISLNGLLHAATSKAQRDVLSAAKRALDPRGQLLIDILNPSPSVLAQFDQSVVLEGVWQRAGGGVVQKFSSRRISLATQTIHTDLWYDVIGTDSMPRRVMTSFDMRFIYPAELELMLELAGFPEWETYGSYDLDPFDDHSERILIAAEAS